VVQSAFIKKGKGGSVIDRSIESELILVFADLQGWHMIKNLVPKTFKTQPTNQTAQLCF